MSTPTPATLKAQHERAMAETKKLSEKRVVETIQQVETSSHVISENTGSTHQNLNGKRTSSKKLRSTNSPTTRSKNDVSPVETNKPFKRTEHLTQKPLRDNPELQKLQEEFKNMENINQQAGWYDRDRNGKQTKAQQNRATVIAQTVQKLRDAVGEKNIVDIGKGAEVALGVSATKKMEAIKLLVEEGYKRYYIPIKKVGDSNLRLTRVVLTAPGTTFKSVVTRKNEIVKLVAWNKTPGMIEKRERVMAMKSSGYSNVAIGEALGINESSVRRLLAIKTPEKENN